MLCKTICIVISLAVMDVTATQGAVDFQNATDQADFVTKLRLSTAFTIQPRRSTYKPLKTVKNQICAILI